MVSLQHPCLLPLVDLLYSRDKQGILIVQPFVWKRSLKDRIFHTPPARSYTDKYEQQYRGLPIAYSEIVRFGRQILEVMQALRGEGIVLQHLSSSNIMIDHGNACIANLYDTILCVDHDKSSRERTIALEARTGVDIDLLCFGHVLYEMATGMGSRSHRPDPQMLDIIAPSIAEALGMIFSPQVRDSSSESEDGAVAPLDCEDCVTCSSGKPRVRVSYSNQILNQLLASELFSETPSVKSAFAGFRLDSRMRATIGDSMHINSSRNRAHIVQYQEKRAAAHARKRAERRVHEETEKQQRRPIQVSATSRVKDLSSVYPISKRQSYRANRFRSPLERQSSSS